MEREPIIGIDLGTTNSLAAFVFETGAEVMGSHKNQAVVPSVLHRSEGHWIVGIEALPYRTTHPESTVYSVKRLMGRGFHEIESELSYLHYSVVPAQRELVKIRIGSRDYTPQELSAEILKKVKSNAESVLGCTIHKAVITVPAYFDDTQRQATRDAGKLAGLDVVRILNEPTAAAIAYGLESKKEGLVAVYDFGGGTFDVSILKLNQQVFQVVSTQGDTHLGGDDLDRILIVHLQEMLKSQVSLELLQDPNTIPYLQQTAEQIKIALSSSPEVSFLIETPNGVHFKGSLTQDIFSQLINSLVEKTLKICQKALDSAKLTVDQITEVVLVGGSSCIPSVRHQVEIFFKKTPHLAIDPYKVVAIGAGIQGHLLAGGRRDFLLLDVVSLSLGIETLGGTFQKLIQSNASIPCQVSELFTTSADNQTSIQLNIYQGERELVKDCRELGRFQLRGIPPMPAGLPKVQVTFRVDANGLLTVSASEERSGCSAQVEVIPSHGLTQFEMDQILEASIENAIEDFNDRHLIEFRNALERILKAIETQWPIAQKLLSPEECKALQQQMQRAKTAALKTNAVDLKTEIDRLGEMTRPLADHIMSDSILVALTE